MNLSNGFETGLTVDIQNLPSQYKENGERLFVYLATPYSSIDPRVSQERFEQVTTVAAALINRGYLVYSPITHSHPMAVNHSLRLDWSYWADLDARMIGVSDVLFVLAIDGWEKSTGVQAEIQIAYELGKKIFYLHPKPVRVEVIADESNEQ